VGLTINKKDSSTLGYEFYLSRNKDFRHGIMSERRKEFLKSFIMC